MKIVIPSYKRPKDIQKTLNTLKDVDAEIYIFIVEEEKELYQYEKVNIIVGVKGLAEQRNFINNYFDEGEILISMDDDIEEVYIKSGKSLQNVLEESVEYLKNSNYGLMGFPPTYNKFFNKAEGYKTGFIFCIGAFYIYKNIRIQVTNSIAEDFERSIKYYLHYGANIRNNDLIFKTKYLKNAGGLNEIRNNLKNIEENHKCVSNLLYLYPSFFRHRCKKGWVDLTMKSIKKTDVVVFPTIDIFDKLKGLISNKIFQKTNNSNGSRTGFTSHYKGCFGLIQPRFKKKGLVLSRSSKEFPEVYEELLRIGRIICPFEFQSIHFLRNCVCPPHKDSKNTQKSILVSFGDYTGCNIVIEGKIYDAKHTPIMFDGRTMEHWNTDDLQGVKYSLIYY